MTRIESTSNDIYKKTKKLQTAVGRKKSGRFIIEGARLVRDACKNGVKPDYIILGDKAPHFEEIRGVKTYCMPDKLFDGLKTTVNSQGILAVVTKKYDDPLKIAAAKSGMYLYLDGVSDPGNMGTILRSAGAFGANGVILSRGCADVFAPKTIRATMAGVFGIRLFSDEDGSLLAFLKKNGFKTTGTFPRAGVLPDKTDYTAKSIIVMGGEANGISADIAKLCDEKITIPMADGTESLNVSVACGIILYEAMIYRKNHNF